MAVDTQLEVTFGDDKFKGRIAVSGEDETSIRNRSMTFLKVDSNDISDYWCEVMPNIYEKNKKSKLQIQGVNGYFFNT